MRGCTAYSHHRTKTSWEGETALTTSIPYGMSTRDEGTVKETREKHGVIIKSSSSSSVKRESKRKSKASRREDVMKKIQTKPAARKMVKRDYQKEGDQNPTPLGQTNQAASSQSDRYYYILQRDPFAEKTESHYKIEKSTISDSGENQNIGENKNPSQKKYRITLW